MGKGLGAMVSRKDLARSIAKNVPVAQRGKAFAIAKEYGVKGAKFTSGKMSATEASRLVKAIKDKSLFKTDVGARGHTAKEVLTKLVVKDEPAAPALTNRQEMRAKEERIKEGGRAMLKDRLKEETEKQGSVMSRALGEKDGASKSGTSKPHVTLAAPMAPTPNTVARTGAKVGSIEALPPMSTAPIPDGRSSETGRSPTSSSADEEVGLQQQESTSKHTEQTPPTPAPPKAIDMDIG